MSDMNKGIDGGLTLLVLDLGLDGIEEERANLAGHGRRSRQPTPSAMTWLQAERLLYVSADVLAISIITTSTVVQGKNW